MGENARLDKYAEALARLQVHDPSRCPDGGCQIIELLDKVDRLQRRAESAEAKVARVEALLNEWRTNADGLALSDVGPFDHTVNLATKGALFDCIDDLRTALDGTN